MRWHLHELDPDLVVLSRSLRNASAVVKVRAVLDLHTGMVPRLALELLTRIVELNSQFKSLEKELKLRVETVAPTLLRLPRCGVLSAAVLLGETAGVHRFRDKDAYARFTGTAPVPVWSGASAGKVRLNRGGNRQAKWAMHMIAVTQARGIGPGRATWRNNTDAARTELPRSGSCDDSCPTPPSAPYAPTSCPNPRLS